MIKNILWLWILFIAAIFLYTFNLGEFPLRDWDEGIVATVAREISQADWSDRSWLYPVDINNSPYWNKPPLIHNLIAFCYHFFGVSELITRCIPAMISAFCVPIIYLIGKEIFAVQRTAIFSAVVYLTLIPVVRHNRLAMLDGAVTFFFCLIALFLLKLYNSHQNNNKEYQKYYYFGVSLSFGLLCLTKGIAIALPALLIFALFILANQKIFKELYFNKSLIIILVILVIGISPAIFWYVLQYIRYGKTFIDYNLGTQTFNRVLNTVENNAQPFWYYLLELVKYSLPWLLFLPQGIILAIKQRRQLWAKLSLIWFGVYLLVISVMNTKLPWYIIPIYPAFALLVGASLDKIIDLQKRKNYQAIFYQLWLTIMTIALAFVTFELFVLSLAENIQQYDGLPTVGTILTIAFAFSSVLINKKSSFFVLTISIGLYFALLNLFTTPHSIWELAESYPVKPVAHLVRENTPATATIYTSYPYYRPSLNFYSDRSIVPLTEVNLPQILRSQPKVYLLLSKDAASIPNSKVIANVDQWILMVVTN